MKNILAVLLAVCLSFIFIAYTEAVPTFPLEQLPEIDVFGAEPYDGYDMYEPDTDTRGDRHRRVTCDFLSVSTPWGSLNHAACAGHCVAMRKGYRGGRCRDGVCHCRR